MFVGIRKCMVNENLIRFNLCARADKITYKHFKLLAVLLTQI